LKLTVTVNESQVVNLKEISITVTSSVYPGQEFNGKIIFIAAKADSSLNFPVEIEISNNVNNDLKAECTEQQFSNLISKTNNDGHT
jgi:hypothetical protein